MEDPFIFAKTAAADVEIKTRALRLAPRLRSTLILVDGKRNVREFAAMLGDEVRAALQQLSDLELIEVASRATAPAPAAAPTLVRANPPAMPPAVTAAGVAAGVAATMAGDIAGDLRRLPDAATRSAHEVEMSQNFMINSVNLIFGQNTRLSLVRSIFDCKSAEELRAVYPRWFSAMADNRNGAKRLAEFRTKLAASL
ncbi:MAG: hypothetical protein ABIN96_10525 [Rubrivivax sp.]